MSYFNNLIEKSKLVLPKEISHLEWDGNLFYMGGDNWNFNSSAVWSIVNDEVFVIGCHDDNVQEFLKKHLIGQRIIQLTHSIDMPVYDPIFIFESGMRLKFFSTTYYEPWTIQFDEKLMFVASPGDKKWIL